MQRYELNPNHPNLILKLAVSVIPSLGSTLFHTDISLFCFGVISLF